MRTHPLDVGCITCGALPGEPCTDQRSNTRQPTRHVHSSRSFAAGAVAARAAVPYADVPPGYYVREDPDYGEVLVPVTEPPAGARVENDAQ